MAATAVAVLAAGMLGVWIGNSGSRASELPPPTVRLEIALPAGDRLTAIEGFARAVAISPDGARIVYSARRDGVERLYLRNLGSDEITAIPGTEGGQGPFFSPDGEWIAFRTDIQMKKVSLLGGSPRVITDFDFPNGVSGNWGDDGRIAFSTGGRRLGVVSAEGGTPAPLAGMDTIPASMPHFLPGGRGLLYSSAGRVMPMDFATGASYPITEGDTPFFTSSGHLAFTRGATLLAAPFDPERRLMGEPIVLAEGIHRTAGSSATVAVSRAGTFVYAPSAGPALGQIGWVDRQGGWEGVTEGGRQLGHPRLSPDARFVAFQTAAVGGPVLVRDLARGTEEVLGPGNRPVWMRDGRRIAFQRQGNIYSISPAGGEAVPFIDLAVASAVGGIVTVLLTVAGS